MKEVERETGREDRKTTEPETEKHNYTQRSLRTDQSLLGFLVNTEKEMLFLEYEVLYFKMQHFKKAFAFIFTI